jgi:hypothetical protein
MGHICVSKTFVGYKDTGCKNETIPGKTGRMGTLRETHHTDTKTRLTHMLLDNLL